MRRSVINYGIPVLSGQHFSGVDWRELERGIHEAILTFEPRILPDTLKVTAIAPADSLGHHNLLQFELRGELWSMPFPIELLIRSELDLETGQVTIADPVVDGSRVNGSADARLLQPRAGLRPRAGFRVR